MIPLRLIIDDEPKLGTLNMAIDEAMMKSFNENDSPILRFYRWQKPCLSIGKFQKISEIDLEFLDEMNIDLVRRPTGGKAVLHDHEITYSFVMPISLFKKKNIIGSYKEIALAISLGLKRIGVDCDLSKKKNDENNNFKSACFSAPSIYEITIDNRKFIGSAQVRDDGVLLQHGSIPFDLDLNAYSKCFKLSSENAKSRLKEILKANTITIEQLNVQPTEEELIASLVKGFEEIFGFESFETDYSQREIETAVSLQAKYASKEWTFRR